MKIIYKTGDALAGPEIFIMHGCNAAGVMGSGIAAQVKKQFPHAFQRYREQYESPRGLKVGDIITGSDGKKVIINAVTQQFFGRDSNVVYVSYDGLRECLSKINEAFKTDPGMRIAMPMIGAGLANGDWSIIECIIEDESTSFQPVVYRL